VYSLLSYVAWRENNLKFGRYLTVQGSSSLLRKLDPPIASLPGNGRKTSKVGTTTCQMIVLLAYSFHRKWPIFVSNNWFVRFFI